MKNIDSTQQSRALGGREGEKEGGREAEEKQEGNTITHC